MAHGVILGPPLRDIGASDLLPYRHPRLGHVSTAQEIEVITDSGRIRLRPRTIQKYLPHLWRGLLESEAAFVKHHGRLIVDSLQFPFPEDAGTPKCVSHLFRHLRELERGDGNATHLLDWLTKSFKSARPLLLEYPSSHNLFGINLYFAKLGKLLDPRHLGSHKRLFQTMSTFFIQHCRQLFDNLSLQEFVGYVYALDRTRHDMSSVLAAISSSIGSRGRRELLRYMHQPTKYSTRLSSQTKRALRKMEDVKKIQHLRHGVGGLIKWADAPGALDRLPGAGQVAKFGVIPYYQKNDLRRRFGRNVVFQSRPPSDYVFYRVLGGHARQGYHRRLYPAESRLRRRSWMGPESPVLQTDYLGSEDGSSDTSYLEDDYIVEPEYGPGHGLLDHGGLGLDIPRRVSYGTIEDGSTYWPERALNVSPPPYVYGPDEDDYGYVHDEYPGRRRSFG